jgi:L-lactate dehydrogenase complex protein LldG
MASSARDKILNRLRSARDPFTDVPPIEEKRRVVPTQDATPDELYTRFIEEAEKLACTVYEVNSESSALEIVLDILGDDDKALMWDAEHIPVTGLQEALDKNGVQPAAINDETARVGITGVDAALAATGSIVVVSGAGKSRQASLLPLVHVAVLKRDQILPDIETFYAQTRRDTFRDHSNFAVISGPSKSADIAMEMIHGMHGPGEMHLVIVP